jgi:hypothetical protein
MWSLITRAAKATIESVVLRGVLDFAPILNKKPDEIKSHREFFEKNHFFLWK